MTRYVPATDMLNQIFSAWRRRPERAFFIPPGVRAYAVGDIHGRHDLLVQMLARIEQDSGGRAAEDTPIIFLGDYVDRGPDSCGVIETLLAFEQQRPNVRFLAGNHEEMLVASLRGDLDALRAYTRNGGREAIQSYGIDDDTYARFTYPELAEALVGVMPERHKAFLDRLENFIVLGDYAFVHAGVRPGIPIEQQSVRDLRWIREPFLSHRGILDQRVVHGHTISDTVEVLPHRIGIDTGAYVTNRLTAVALEADQHRLLEIHSS